jgi:hypothetical protein
MAVVNNRLEEFPVIILIFIWQTQASWRKIQQLSLVPLYKNDDDFRLFSGMMDSLAYLPVPDLTNGIHLLRALCPDGPPEAT